MLAIVLLSAALLITAYFTYGSVLARLLRLDRSAVTPAVELRDDVDYAPIEPAPLLSQHFSAIAAAGPIVGPIAAGVMFGWLPALIWILIGSIFIGGVHDFTALVVSIRHRACSVAEVVREHMSRRSFVLFLAFVWLALVYIIVAFTDITAGSFVGAQKLENGQVVPGAAIATSSLLYLVLPVVMGLLVRYTGLSMNWATAIFLPLVGLAIWGGQHIPFDIEGLVRRWDPALSAADAESVARKSWDIALLAYCCVASVVPMWLLLQPRGQLGGYFLYAALAAGAIGLMVGGKEIRYPMFRGWTAPTGETLFPILFITIACGACSGFHALIASGTTSKQLRRETDAKSIGYGAMLLEAMVAIVSLCCVMMLAENSPLTAKAPNYIYSQGIGAFLETIRVPAALGISFALMAFTTFVYDTLDVCTRLGRYIVQELTGWHDARGRWLGTLLTAGVPVIFLLRPSLDATGEPIAVWKAFWNLFGASNQLLAALTLLGVTVWLWRTRRAWWVWLVTGVPTAWMYAVSTWGLLGTIRAKFAGGVTTDPVAWVAVVLVVLAALMLVEAALALFGTGTTPRRPGRLEPATLTA
jgi:carbon starvation protein